MIWHCIILALSSGVVLFAGQGVVGPLRWTRSTCVLGRIAWVMVVLADVFILSDVCKIIGCKHRWNSWRGKRIKGSKRFFPRHRQH